MEAQPNKLNGVVAYIYAFDIAYDLKRQPLTQLLGHRVTEVNLDANKRAPRELFLYRAQMVQMPNIYVDVEGQRVEGALTLRLLPTGAVSVKYRIPFKNRSLKELTSFHSAVFGSINLQEQARKLAKDVMTELGSACIRPNTELPAEEAYTVFIIHQNADANLRFNCQDWLTANRTEVGALLTQEDEPENLAIEEIHENTGQALSYYKSDLAVIDWDAALLIDTPANSQETLYILELANLQLAELEAYDRILDQVLERAYRDLQNQRSKKKSVIKDLKEIRVDMARFSDELSNATKFLGDWHYARIYQLLAKRFHLSEWQSNITGKLKTADELYDMLQAEQNHHLMVVLEVAIVALFVFEVIPQIKDFVLAIMKYWP